MNEITNQTREALQGERGNYAQLCRDLHISRRWLGRFIAGEFERPNPDRIIKIRNYLALKEQMRRELLDSIR